MLSDLRYRLRAIFRRGALERDLDDELRFHLDQQVTKQTQAGVPRAEAERRARLLLGGVEQVKEASRDGRGISPLEILVRDLRYAARVLAKSPGFTFVAVASLTLGIGANTAMFQLLNAVALTPLPVEHPEQIVEVRMRESDLDVARGSFRRTPSVTNRLWERIRREPQEAVALFAWSDDGFNLAAAGDTRSVPGLWVSGELFPTLGIVPALGRLFAPADDRPGCGLPGVVISHDFWQREYGGDRSIVGRTIAVDSQRAAILGVTPAGFFGLEVGQTFDVALPVCSIAALRPADHPLENGTSWWLMVMGRLKPGWTPERADTQLRALSAGVFADTLPANYPAGNVRQYLASLFTVRPAGNGISELRERYASPLTLLLAMTGLVLLIACANLANLMLTRGAIRGREFALRLALGASRGRLLSQLLSESLLIAVVSAGAGLLLALVLSRALIALLGTPRDPIALTMTADWHVFAFTAGTAALVCLLLGLAPAVRASHGSPGDVLRTGSRGATRDRESLVLRRALMVTQVAVSLVLVVGALLFVRSFRNLTAVPLGFQDEGVLIVQAGLPPPVPPADVREAMTRDLLARLRALPGVAGVAQSNLVPLSGATYANTVWMDGGDKARARRVSFSYVSAGYFQTLRMPLLAGRDFDERDLAPPGTAVDRERAAIVNESFARTVAGSGNPVGQRFRIESTSRRPERVLEIIGVVGDARYAHLREEPPPVAFIALAPEGLRGAFLLRTALSPEAAASTIKQALFEVNPEMRFSLGVLDTLIGDTLVRERVLALLSGIFGLLAALLAAIGLHGIIAYTVERRRRELGIRLALGATRANIVSSVMGESGRWVAAGLMLGVVASLAVTRMAQTLLFGLQPGDPATLAAAVASLALVALLAAWLPARRAARVDPMTTLKDE